MDALTVIGSLAAVCSMMSFAPQVWKTIKTRDTEDLSSRMYALTVAGFLLWLAYGILKQDWPITITNGVCLAFSSFILLMTLMPKRGKAAVADTLDPKV